MCCAEVRSATQAALDDTRQSACFRRFFAQSDAASPLPSLVGEAVDTFAEEDLVRKWIAVPVAAALLIAGAGRAHAQDTTTPGPDVVEVTIIPGGVGFVSSKNKAPSFGNYGFGFATTYNINSVIGVEGDIAALIATTSNLQFGDLRNQGKAPNFLNYNVSAIVRKQTDVPRQRQEAN